MLEQQFCPLVVLSSYANVQEAAGGLGIKIGLLDSAVRVGSFFGPGGNAEPRILVVKSTVCGDSCHARARFLPVCCDDTFPP